MMIRLISWLFIFGTGSLYGQKIEIIVADSQTKLPIPDVIVDYRDNSQSLFTNEDGKCSLAESKDSITLISYFHNSRVFAFDQIRPLDTIYLSPKVFELEAVAIDGFMLKKALRYVMQHYSKLYVDHPALRDCTLKEIVKVDEEYRRLILTELQWWSPAYAYTKKKGKLQHKVKLQSINYSKNIPLLQLSASEGEQGFLLPGVLEKKMYLNTIVNNILSDSRAVISRIVREDETSKYISFENDWEGLDYRYEGTIIFDRSTKAITELTMTTFFKDRKAKMSDGAAQQSFDIFEEAYTVTLKLAPTLQKKLSLKFLNIETLAQIRYKGRTQKAQFITSLYVAKEIRQKSYSDKGLINLDIPFYKNVPSSVLNSGTITLSAKEKQFLEN